jgi:hypothetical protein
MQGGSIYPKPGGSITRNRARRCHAVPIQPEPLQKLPQSIRVVNRAALCAAGAEERSAGIGYGAAAAADFNDGLELQAVEGVRLNNLLCPGKRDHAAD